MNIRKAEIKDLDIIVEFNYNLAYETEHKELNMEILKNGVEALLNDSNKGVYHVCEVNGVVVGQIMYTYEWSDWRNGTFIWVQSVYVHKDFRGQGIFRKLYNHVKDMCDNDRLICGIRLYVEFDNDTAKKTYSNLGMTQCNYHMYEYEK